MILLSHRGLVSQLWRDESFPTVSVESIIPQNTNSFSSLPSHFVTTEDTRLAQGIV